MKSIRWVRIWIGLTLVVLGIGGLWLDARLGIGERAQQPVATAPRGASVYLPGAPSTGYQDAGALRIGVLFLPRVPALPRPPAGQVYVVVSVHVHLGGTSTGGLLVSPLWFTIRAGHARRIVPLSSAPGTPSPLRPTRLAVGQTMAGTLIYLVPSNHPPLGFVAAVPASPGYHLTWNVPGDT